MAVSSNVFLKRIVSSRIIIDAVNFLSWRVNVNFRG